MLPPTSKASVGACWFIPKNPLVCNRIYKDGVPEHKLQSVVDQLGKYKCIHLTIELPFFNQPLNGPKIIDVTSKTNISSKKAFHFINTRFDHVDELVDTHSHECDQDRLSALLAELDLKICFWPPTAHAPLAKMLGELPETALL